MKNKQPRQPKKRKAGRPKKQPGEKYRTPVMPIGRVDLETQATLRKAAKRAGETFTAWATSRLMEAAKREL